MGGPGGILGILGCLCRQSGAQEEARLQSRWPKMRSKRPTGANMGAKMVPKWRYDGLLGSQDGQLGSILGAILAHLSHLGANFNENVKKQKTFKNLLFFKGFWKSGGVHLGPFGGHVQLCWRILATRWAILGHLGAMWGHLGDKMRPKSAKMSPRWRPGAPRGANMSEKGSQHKPVLANEREARYLFWLCL